MTTDETDKDKAFLHFDSVSFGIYPFPVQLVEVGALPPDWPQLVEERGSYGFAVVDDTRFKQCEAFTPRGILRSNPALKDPVLSWLRMAPSAAPMVLVQALPAFWLGRYRPKREVREALGKGQSVDVAPNLKERKPLRTRLREHAQSLSSKLWALQYHEGQFRQHTDAARGAQEPWFELTAASADFRAYAETVYSLLDETARALSIMHSISSGSHTAHSFHELHKRPTALAPQLRDLLKAAAWYEGFRLLRANSAHSFAAFVHRNEDDELLLYQHPDQNIYNGATVPPPEPEEVETTFSALSSSFRPFYASLCQYALSLFHPWDVAVIPTADPGLSAHSLQPVWVRRVAFDSKYETDQTSWAMLSKTGEVIMRTLPEGGLAKGSVASPAQPDSGAADTKA